MKNIKDIPQCDFARIAYHMQLLGLDPETQFTGELVVPAGKTVKLDYHTPTSGTHVRISPKDIAHAKLALGVPDSTYECAKPYNRFQKIRMVSAEKDTNALSTLEVAHLHQAAKSYIYGKSSDFAFMKAAIDKHLSSSLTATVYVYTQLDLHGELQLIGKGNPVVLIAHTINVFEGGSISTDDSPITINVTDFNSVKSGNAKAALGDTVYDVQINLGTGANGANGTNGTNGVSQIKANNGTQGESGCCTDVKPGAGDNGQPGGNGIAGTNGMPGSSIAEAVFFVQTLNCNVNVIGNGGNGGNGGIGGNGGNGGEGGNGGTGNGTGEGGDGGNGGNGASGGAGGTGGNGGNVVLYVQVMTTKIFDASLHGGVGGTGGTGGTAGSAAAGGTGSPAGGNGVAGTPGNPGAAGASGAEGQIIVKQSTPPAIDGFTPNSGAAAGGTLVTILGSNFYKTTTGASAMQFRINNLPMTGVNIISTVEATALTPPGTATSAFPIVVINTETMASAASAQNFVYTT